MLKAVFRPSPWPERVLAVGATFAVLGLAAPTLVGMIDADRENNAAALAPPLFVVGVLCILLGLAAIANRRQRSRTGQRPGA